MLIEFHPSAADAFYVLLEADQERVDAAIEVLSSDPKSGGVLHDGPLRQYEAGGVVVVYLVADPATMIIIGYIEVAPVD